MNIQWPWTGSGAAVAAEVVRPVVVPELPPYPPAPPDRGERFEQNLRRIVVELGDSLDEGSAGPALDPIIEAWQAEWEAEDDRAHRSWLELVNERASEVDALVETAEVVHERCASAWRRAEHDFRLARARLGALDPDEEPDNDPHTTAGPRPLPLWREPA